MSRAPFFHFCNNISKVGRRKERRKAADRGIGVSRQPARVHQLEKRVTWTSQGLEVVDENKRTSPGTELFTRGPRPGHQTPVAGKQQLFYQDFDDQLGHSCPVNSELSPPVTAVNAPTRPRSGEWPAVGDGGVTACHRARVVLKEGHCCGPWHGGAAPSGSEGPSVRRDRGLLRARGAVLCQRDLGTFVLQRSSHLNSATYSFLLKLVFMNGGSSKGNVKMKFQLPINSSSGLFYLIIQGSGTVHSWEGQVLQP